MLTQAEVSFVSPDSVDALAERRKEFEFLFNFIPNKLSKSDVWEFLKNNIPSNTLVYYNGVLVGCFTMDIKNKSVELHGVFRPDVSSIVPNHKKFKIAIFRLIFDDIFNTLQREKIVIKAEDANRDVFGFAMLWGFRRLKYKDKGETVWVLDRSTYTGRKIGKEVSTKG